MRHALSALLVLASCGALPDEVSVSGFSSEYDFLGGDNLKGLGSEDGTSTGAMVTATYKIKPTQIQIVQQPNAPIRVPDDLDAQKLLGKAEEKLDNAVGKAADDLKGLSMRKIEDFLEIPISSLGSKGVLAASIVAILLLLLILRRKRQPTTPE